MADLVKKVELKIVADDGDAQAKLDAIKVKADKLRADFPEFKVKIDTAEATAKMAVFREELKAATRKATAEINTKVGGSGLLGRLLLGSNGGGGLLGGKGFLSGLDNLPAGGLPGIAAITAGVAALLPELAGVVSGLTAATAGVGAFGLLALPTFDKIKNAYTAISTAQKNYNNAVALNKENPTAANAKAAANALVKLRVAQEGVSGSTKTAVTGIQSLVKSFEKMAAAFAPTVMKVFNDGLKIANSLLPVVAGFANAAAPAIDGLVRQLGKFTQSKGFKDWIGQFSKLIGPSITAIGTGIGKVVIAVGKLLTVMSRKDVVHTINILFDSIAGTIRGLTWLVHRLMLDWDQDSAGVARFWRNVKHWTDIGVAWVKSAFDVVRRIFNYDIPVWINTGLKWFNSLPGRILHAIGNLGSLLFPSGKAIISGLISGIQSMLGPLGSVLSGITHLIPNLKGPMQKDKRLLYPNGMAIIDGLIGGISGRTPQLARQLARTTGVIQRGIPGTSGSRTAGGHVVLEFRGGQSAFDQFMLGWVRKTVQARGGGDVQVTFGRTA